MSPISDFFLLSKDQILQKAEKLRSEGKHAKAAELLASGIKKTAEDYELLIALAAAHLADRRGRDAVLALKDAVAVAPAKSGDIMELAERFYYTEGQLPEMGDLAFEMNLARRNFDPAVKIAKNMSDRDTEIMLTRLNKLKESLDHYQGPAKPAGVLAREMTTYYGVALLTERRGQAPQALAVLDSIINRCPDEGDNVLAAAAKLASYHPGDSDVMLLHGDLLLKLGKRDRAMELYVEAAKGGAADRVANKLESALQSDPGNLGMMTLLSRLSLQRKDPARALGLIKRLIELDRSRMEEWINDLREVVKLDPRLAEAHLLLGDASLEADKLDLAMAGYAQVAELEPGRLEEVLERYQRVLERSPGNFEAAARIIDAYIAAGQAERALDSLRRMVAKDPALVDLAQEKLEAILRSGLEQPSALEFLAQCYRLRNKRSEAAAILRYLAGLGGGTDGPALAELQQLAGQDPTDLRTMIILLETLIEQGRLSDSARLGGELARRHPASWPEYLPALERASHQGGAEYNAGLAGICQALNQAEQSHPAIDLVQAWALAESGQAQPAADLLARLSRDPQAGPAASRTLEELAGKHGEAAPLQLALADLNQERGELDAMARALLAAVRADRGVAIAATGKLNQLLEQSPENPDLQMLQMELLYQERLYDKALQKAGEIIARWPDAKGARAQLRQGQVLLEKGELTKAAGSLMKAADLDDTLAPEAAGSLNRVLEIDQSSLPGHYALARVLIRQGLFDQAIDELMLVAQKDPRLSPNIAQDLKNIQKLVPANAKALLAEAGIDLNLGQPDQALSALAQLMEISPESFPQAEELYQKLLAAHPGDHRIELGLARAYILGGEVDKAGQLIGPAAEADPSLQEQAISLLRLAQQRAPANRSVPLMLARVYRRRGDHEHSLALLKGAIEDPELAEAAAGELQELIAGKPDAITARYLLADLFRRNRQPEAEVREYQAIYKSAPDEGENIMARLEETLAQSPDLVAGVILRARIQAELGRHSEAVAGYLRACELDNAFRPAAAAEIEKMLAAAPARPEITEALGTIYFEMGKFSQARDLLARAAAELADPERRMRALFFLAESHLALRDEAAADQAMDQVRGMMPDANDVYKALRRFASRRLQVEIDKAYQALQEAPDDQYRKLELAAKLIMVQKHDAAINLLGFKPLDEETAGRRLLLLARAFWGRREAVAAMELLRQVPLEGHPFSRFQLEACYLLGQCYESLGNYAGAAAAYRRVYMDQTDFRDVRARMEWSAERAVLKELEHRGTMLEASA